MKLNYKKSGFLVINGGKVDVKKDIKLHSGWLAYNNFQKYLGVIVTDDGAVNTDVKAFLEKKKKEVNVKLASFLTKNPQVPISIKLKVLDACVNSALTYACETWGSYPLNTVEILQRTALKMILGVSSNTANAILYVESGRLPLKPSIYKRQLKYYRKMKSDCENNFASPISNIFVQALNKNVTFLRHYKRLDRTFRTPEDCFKFYSNLHHTETSAKLQKELDSDPDSIHGTYLKLNPTIKSTKMYTDICCNESDRNIITRFRVGCHKLNIQSGRISNADRENRLCKCSNAVQTLHHVLFDCSLTDNIRRVHNFQRTDLATFFNDNDLISIASALKAITKVMI